MSEKLYVSYNQIHKIIQKNAEKIKEKFNPEVILAIGGGGYIPSRILRTFVKATIIGVGLRLYTEEEGIHEDGLKKMQWLDEYAIKELKGKRVLIVDEVDDTRTTLHYCVEELSLRASELGVFVLHNKKKEKKELDVSFYLAGEEVEGDAWIVYPWESKDIEEHDKCIRK